MYWFSPCWFIFFRKFTTKHYPIFPLLYRRLLVQRYRYCFLAGEGSKKENRYTTLRDTSDTIMQWDKLALLEAATGCKAYFLLYNGKNNYSYSDTDSCNKIFKENQLGCTLVEPKDIERLASMKRAGRFINPTFEDIHPDYAKPWHILVCCNQRNLNSSRYSFGQILESNPLLEKVGVEKIDQIGIEDLTGYEGIDGIPLVSNNSINIASRDSGWNPTFRIIIRTTSSLNQFSIGS